MFLEAQGANVLSCLYLATQGHLPALFCGFFFHKENTLVASSVASL